MQLEIQCKEEFEEYQTRCQKWWENWSDEKDLLKYDNYLSDIKNNLQLDIKAMNFKRCEFYHTVVLLFKEENCQEVEKNYGHLIRSYDRHRLIALCNLVDSVGKPKKVNTFIGRTDPANIKYIFHSLSVLKHIEESRLDNIDIIEIGGGYGGLAFFLKNIASDIGVNINSYTIFDLKEAGDLQKRVLDNFGIDVCTRHISDQFSLANNSYLISNYGYSELNESHKIGYIEKVFPFISNGFLTWNVTPLRLIYFTNIDTDVIKVTGIEKIRCKDLRVVF